MNKFDIAIIGAGPGGYSLAAILAKSGKKVALFEEKNFGGTCVNWGCIPTKTLLKSAKVQNLIHESKKYGISSSSIFHFDAIFNNVKSNSMKLQNAIKGTLTASGVTIFEERATVADDFHINTASGKTIEFEKLVLATGSSSRNIQIKGAEQANVFTSDALILGKTDFDELTIIGGGPISLEFANFFSAFNKTVTIIEGAPKIFGRFDAAVNEAATTFLKEKQVKLFENTKVLEYKNGSLILDKNGEIFEHKTKNILVAVGRTPNNQSFEKLGLKFSPNGFVEVNEFFQTSKPHIYALGDVTGKLMLSTVAYKHGDIIAKHILTGTSNEVFNASQIPWTIYASTEIAGLGQSEEQLKKDNVAYQAVTIPAAALPRAHAENNFQTGFIKVLFSTTNFKLLGAYIFLDNASLLINQLALAMSAGLTIFDLQKSAYTHPTLSESIYYISRQVSFSNLDKSTK